MKWNENENLTAFYLILKHIIMELKYKIHLFLQAWNEIDADNQENLEKTKQNKTKQNKNKKNDGVVIFTHSLSWMC